MEFLIAVILIALFAGFVYWRLDVRKKKKAQFPTGPGAVPMPPRAPDDLADKL